MTVCCSFVESSSLTVGRVVVDCATSEWIPIVSGVPLGSLLCSLLFILCTREMFELVNRLYAYADDSTLLAEVGKQQKHAVAASLDRGLVRNQEWCNQWCMILNPNKTKAFFVSSSRTVNTPHGDLVLSGVLSTLVPTSRSLA